MSTESVIAEIEEERTRQVTSEGWTESDDDGHRRGQLAQAAIAFVVSALTQTRMIADGASAAQAYSAAQRAPKPSTWPFRSPWKPKAYRRALICAAALLVAEVERLDRAAQRP